MRTACHVMSSLPISWELGMARESARAIAEWYLRPADSLYLNMY